AGDERAQVAGHRPGLVERERPAEGGHDGPPAFDHDVDDLGVRARGLPAWVREIRNVGDVPDASAVDAVAADAVAIVEPHHDALLLVGAPYPLPRARPASG